MGGIILKPGQKKRIYEIVRELNRGAFAIAYEAKTPSGERVFFKQYKSPSQLVDWYPGFVKHQKEIKERIKSDRAATDRCYRFGEFFEEGGFYQTFEFIDGGKSLTDCLAKRSDFSWDKMVVFAKVMMFGIKALHQVKIVHTDLKPDNIILIPDEEIKGYKLRIVDLDWAIFSDKKAPWDGKQGYVGTPNYLSTEHIKTTVPLPASDIFTCGIMLGEVLGGKHPFAAAGDAYNEAILAGRYDPIRLVEPIAKVDNQPFLESILNSCLNPDPAKRPTAEQVCMALTGEVFPWSAAPVPEREPPRKSSPRPEPIPPKPVPEPVAIAKSVGIEFNGKLLTTANADGEFGKQLFKSADADAQFLSNPQFKLLKRNGNWVIEHCPSATNETIVDGHKLVNQEPVRDGMRVSVGNSAKGVEKFPLRLMLNR